MRTEKHLPPDQPYQEAFPEEIPGGHSQHRRPARQPSAPPKRLRRRRSKLVLFLAGFGTLALGILIAKYALIPLLVWIETLVGGNP